MLHTFCIITFCSFILSCFYSPSFPPFFSLSLSFKLFSPFPWTVLSKLLFFNASYSFFPIRFTSIFSTYFCSLISSFLPPFFIVSILWLLTLLDCETDGQNFCALSEENFPLRFGSLIQLSFFSQFNFHFVFQSWAAGPPSTKGSEPKQKITDQLILTTWLTAVDWPPA